jgi:hypothetical protein
MLAQIAVGSRDAVCNTSSKNMAAFVEAAASKQACHGENLFLETYRNCCTAVAEISCLVFP